MSFKYLGTTNKNEIRKEIRK